MTGLKIRAVSRQNLDVDAYNQCVRTAPSACIYALSWYLDATAEKWYALVLGAYEAVMPIPIRRKWGISYVYQPFMIQQLGVFPSGVHDSKFFQNMLSRHIHVDYTFHSSDYAPSSIAQVNLTLQLNKSLEDITDLFSSNRKRDLKKASKQELHLSNLTSWEEIQQVISGNLVGPYHNASDIVHRLVDSALSPDHIKSVAVYYQKQCIFFLLYGLSGQRIYYLLPLAINPLAKEMGVATWVVVQLIKQYQSKYSIFDFEGSQVPGVRKVL